MNTLVLSSVNMCRHVDLPACWTMSLSHQSTPQSYKANRAPSHGQKGHQVWLPVAWLESPSGPPPPTLWQLLPRCCASWNKCASRRIPAPLPRPTREPHDLPQPPCRTSEEEHQGLGSITECRIDDVMLVIFLRLLFDEIKISRSWKLSQILIDQFQLEQLWATDCVLVANKQKIDNVIALLSLQKGARLP